MRDLGWRLYSPQFDYHKSYYDFDMPWYGHIFFGYDLVVNTAPRKIVELGTHKGTSLFAFAQAAKDMDLDTEITAIDTWQGDPSTGLYDGDEVYSSVANMIREHYGAQSIRLLRSTFDDALGSFEDGSIDLLHIDGEHTLEAAMHDYETWRPKLAKDATVLFHDTIVADFGVWMVWDKACKEYPDAKQMAFRHNHGLGVIMNDARYLGDDKYNALLTRYYEGCAVNYLLKHTLGLKPGS